MSTVNIRPEGSEW